MRLTSLIVPLALFVAAPLLADNVYLKNGRVFEDVVAEVGPESVKIHLAFGQMGVSLDSVDRIERAESSLVAYQERRDALRVDPTAEAADWVELAQWALRRDNRYGAREAALVAAEKNPRAEGLEELMRRMDYVFEPEIDRWIPFEDSMRLRGFARVDGQWLSPEQLLARSQAAAEAARARESDRESRLTRAVLAMAAAQLAREPEPRQPEVVYAWPVSVYPNPFIRRYPNPHELPPPGHDPTAIPLPRRQPGSLFPVAPNPAVRPVATNHGRLSSGVTPSDGSH